MQPEYRGKQQSIQGPWPRTRLDALLSLCRFYWEDRMAFEKKKNIIYIVWWKETLPEETLEARLHAENFTVTLQFVKSIATNGFLV